MLPPALWGFLGLFAGGWKLAILAGALFALFGRRLTPLAMRWLSPTTRRPMATASNPPSQERSRFGDRVYIALVVLAATALATWILAHFTIARSGH